MPLRNLCNSWAQPDFANTQAYGKNGSDPLVVIHTVRGFALWAPGVTSPVVTWADLLGLAPKTKLQAPQIEIWNAIDQWSHHFPNVKSPAQT